MNTQSVSSQIGQMNYSELKMNLQKGLLPDGVSGPYLLKDGSCVNIDNDKELRLCSIEDETTARIKKSRGA